MLSLGVSTGRTGASLAVALMLRGREVAEKELFVVKSLQFIKPFSLYNVDSSLRVDEQS